MDYLLPQHGGYTLAYVFAGIFPRDIPKVRHHSADIDAVKAQMVLDFALQISRAYEVQL